MMRNDKLIIGITGGSGAGKTTVSDMFRENGITVIDADVVAREVVRKGEPALSEIAECFEGVILSDGTLDRKKLGSIVFSDKEKLCILNGITHKYITKRIHELIDADTGKLCAVDGAALFESGLDRECDVMCAVVADTDVRIGRITARDGISKEQAEARIESQMSDSEYSARCRFVILNNESLDETKRQVLDVINEILKEIK